MDDTTQQNAIIDHLQGRSAIPTNLKYPQRFFAYRRSFITRTISTLSDSMLGQLRLLFGAPLVEEILLNYFTHHPPKSSLIRHSLNDLPQFISQFGEGSYCHLFAALAETSLATWDLIYGPDPGPQGSPLYRLIPLTDGVDLYSAWVNSDIHGKTTTTLLLVKTGIDELAHIKVEANIFVFVKRLTKGLSITEAIESLSEEELAGIDQGVFGEFLNLLNGIGNVGCGS